MDIPFRPITIRDKEAITSLTLPSDNQNCDFSFANMCSWRFLYDSEFAVSDGFLLIRFLIEDKSRFAYMMPVGNGDMKAALVKLQEDSMKHGHPLCMLGITNDNKKILETLMPNDFYYIDERDFYDYVYLRENLAMLSGKKYQPKRNHINNFKKRYNYEYINITPQIVPQCLELECKWFKANRTDNDTDELSDERRSMTFALHNADELGLIGGAIRVDGEIIAFSFGAPINHNTFGVHVEKADTRFEGAYTVINQEYAAHLPEQYIYMNREEDLGIPGLRQAKLSYQPIMLEKCAAVMNAEAVNNQQ